MKVYIKPNFSSRAIDRIVEQLIKYAPASLQFVENEEEAELVILHVNGRRDAFTKKAGQLLAQGKKYAVIQYVFKSSKNPTPGDWVELWNKATVIWSYYDLRPYCEFNNFYHAPLGVDPEVFKVTNQERVYKIATVGPSYLTESVRECIIAAENLRQRVFNLGPDVAGHPRVYSIMHIEDRVLADFYNKSQYVSGLRRIEGFELPAAEGLLCGARPILFDKPHYRQWYDGLAIFIPEDDRDGVIRSLQAIFEGQYTPVSQAEIEEAKKRFNWSLIATGFWNKCLI